MDQDINNTRMTEPDLGQSDDEAPDNHPRGPSYTVNHAFVDAFDVALKELDLVPLKARIDDTYPEESGCDHNLSLGSDFDYGFPTSEDDDEHFRMQHESEHSNDDDVCQRCKSFRWEITPPSSVPSIFIYMTKSQLAASYCRICRFLARIIEA